MTTTNEKMLRNLNSYLRGLARRRSSGTVTSDDAHIFLTRNGVSSKQIRTRLSYINSVFSTAAFESVGSVPSSRPSARGRMITEWVLSN